MPVTILFLYEGSSTIGFRRADTKIVSQRKDYMRAGAQTRRWGGVGLAIVLVKAYTRLADVVEHSRER